MNDGKGSTCLNGKEHPVSHHHFPGENWHDKKNHNARDDPRLHFA
jgi:hypothetical protein